MLVAMVCLQVRAVFEQLQEPDWLVQDASLPIEQIHQQVRCCMVWCYGVVMLQGMELPAASYPTPHHSYTCSSLNFPR